MTSKFITLIPAVVLAGALLSGCAAEESPEYVCAPAQPQAMGPQVQLQNVEFPLPLKGGGGGGGGGKGGGGGSTGGSKGGSSSGGKPSYSPPKVGTKPSPDSGTRLPSTGKPGGSYRPTPGQPVAPAYVRQPDGMLLPFIGGIVVGDMLSEPPAGCPSF